MKKLIVLVVAIVLCLVATNSNISIERVTGEVAVMSTQEENVLVANDEVIVSALSLRRRESAVVSNIVVVNPITARESESAVAILNLKSIGRAAPGDNLVAIVTNDLCESLMASATEESGICVLKLPIVNYATVIA